MAAKVKEGGEEGWEEKTRRQIRRQVACEERAFHMVEQLLEETVTEENLISSCQLLQPHHYADIVEERAIDKRCGYPICPNPLGYIPAKKYHISTKHNKIYDITERKNFCSDQCLAASRFLAKQIPTSPVWMRDSEPPSPISLLPRHLNKGEKGDEIIGPSTLAQAPELQSSIPKREMTKEDGRRSLGLGRSSSSSQGTSPSPKQASSVAKASSSSEIPPGKGALDSMDSSLSPELPSQRGAQALSPRVSASSDEVEVCTRLSTVSIQDGDVSSHQCELTDRMGQMTLKQAESSPDPAQSLPLVCPDSKGGMQGKDTVTAANSGHSATAQVPSSGQGGRKPMEQLELQQAKPEGKAHSDDKSQRPGESKTDYLMRLLDKRKHLLAKMADIQDNPCHGGNSASTSSVASNKERDERTTVSRDEKRVSSGDKGDDTVNSSSQNQANSNTSQPDVSSPDSHVTEHKSAVPASTPPLTPTLPHTSESMPGSTGSKQTASQDSDGNRGGKASQKPTSQAGRKKRSPQTSPSTPNPLEVVARQVQAWVTPATTTFISRAEAQEVGTGRTRQELEAACLRLEAIAAVRERELERLEELEEQGQQEEGAKRHRHIPTYEILAHQTQEFSVKVQQFFSGDRVTIKDVENTDKENPVEKVYLPPVDSHDQMQIRYRIVLERLDKVLPELLSSLALSIQEVTTPLRELVHSFSLASDNISFRPPQWILVALILLQMLSRREEKIQAGFARAPCVRYISTLLGGIGLTIADLQSTTSSLLQTQALGTQS